MNIFTNNEIEIDGKRTGYAVYQKYSKTVVYHYLNYREIEMPMQRYTLSTQAGRELFKRHFIDATNPHRVGV
jgi:hypothetical protein